jgi:hypothetical protein
MKEPAPWDALGILAARMPRVVREHEVLRVAATLFGADTARSTELARREVLTWAQRRSGGQLPSEAWEFQEFDYLSGGRNSVAVRLREHDTDIWAIRADDPDKEVPGRVWTTEVIVGQQGSRPSRFGVRLLVSTPEDNLEIAPHTPGCVQQVVNKAGLVVGAYTISAEPHLINSDEAAETLIEKLVDTARILPVFVLTVPEDSIDQYRPLLDAGALARAILGLGEVVIVPASYTWKLTQQFGKRRSVFGGAVRAYLPGFTEDANPYTHRLVLANQLATSEGIGHHSHWIRSLAASESVRRVRLGNDVLAFGTIRNATLQFKQQRLEQEGASDSQKLEAAHARIKALEADQASTDDMEKFLLDENQQASERAEKAEEQLVSATFRIQRLLEQIRSRGQDPDDNIQLPTSWSDFSDWCDTNLVGRAVLTAHATKSLRAAIFGDVQLAARCLMWLANEYRDRRMNGGDGSLRDYVLEPGIKNSPCGADEFKFLWRGQSRLVDWHIKNGGNTRDPGRCLRIYYFWSDETQEVVVADMPAHRHTGAT